MSSSQRFAELASKLGGGLAQLAIGGAGLAGANAASAGSDTGQFSGLYDSSQMPVYGDKVVIDASSSDGDTAALLAELEALGLENGAAWGNTVSGFLPIASLEAAAGLASLGSARGAQAIGNVGSVENDADVSMNSDDVRTTFGIDGTGVTVGVMSDSFDNIAGGAAADVASGDLPNNIVVLEDLASGGSDEGRAMLQLAHDIAPGADLMFHTAFGGQANFANGIISLMAAGADIIVDDIFYFAEPYFQDGIVTQAADLAMRAGVAYFTSAGNSSADSYEATFRPSGSTISYTNGNGQAVVGEYHDFDPGAGVDIVQSITIGTGGSFTMTMQWDEPFSSVSAQNGGAAEDYDVLLTDNTGAIIANLTASTSTIGGDPVEIFQISNSGAEATVNLSITRTNQGAEATDNFLKYVLLRWPGTTVNEFDTQSSTVVGHSNSALAISVGAAFFGNTPEFGVDPPVKESFSSFGGTDILFDTVGNRLGAPEVRDRPQITAPDGSNNTFFGSDTGADADANPNFFGTSAAAPNAAAVAALLLELNPNATPDDILNALVGSAIDMDNPNTVGFDTGFDVATGAGLIQADVAAGLLNFDDVITGTSGVDSLNGQGGDDNIIGRGGDDTLLGGIGNDFISAGDGADMVNGQTGDDTLFGGDGDDMLCGGDGTDLLVGGAGADLLVGNAGTDTLRGDAGDDRLFGGSADDDLEGGAGVDRLNGESGADFMSGGAGNDIYFVDDAGDILFEEVGGGFDKVTTGFLSFVLDDEVERLDFSGTGDNNGDGNASDNVMNGTSGANVLNGLAGADLIHGLGGNDTLAGGDGDDRLLGGAGEDTITGGIGADLLQGGADNDEVYGRDGDDRISGQGGNDVLRGGAGADLIQGGAGDDIINGEAGADRLLGDAGADLFVFSSLSDMSSGLERDRIFGFVGADGDRIDLSAIDADTSTVADDAFTVVGAFTGTAGEALVEVSGVNFLVGLDVNGDGLRDAELFVQTGALAAGDFIL